MILAFLAFLKAPLKAEIVAKAKPAVVEIFTRDATGTPKVQGTGFFISPDGLVVTNQHVIEGADSITPSAITEQYFYLNESSLHKRPVWTLLFYNFMPLMSQLKLGQSTTAVEGQKVIVIGNPTGLMGIVSDGIISAFREILQ